MAEHRGRGVVLPQTRYAEGRSTFHGDGPFRLCCACGGRWRGSARRTTPCVVIGSGAWAGGVRAAPQPESV
jgi:hypothetical protein